MCNWSYKDKNKVKLGNEISVFFLLRIGINHAISAAIIIYCRNVFLEFQT